MKEINKLNLGCDTDDSIRDDSISHFMNRLAYCRTEELRRWFTLQESRLFKARLKNTTQQYKQAIEILKEGDIRYEYVGDEEWKMLKDKITFKLNKIDKNFPDI